MKKFFFLALMAFLWLPATTWADADEHTGGDHDSGQVDGSDDEVYDGEEEDDYGSIVPSEIQLTYKIKSQPTGNYGAENYEDGTVELESVYYVPSGITSYSLSIPHEIQVVNVDMSTLTAEVALYTVIGIGEGAFSQNTQLTSLTIPYTVQYIGESAFERCSALSSVAVTDGDGATASVLTEIRENAFSHLINTDLNEQRISSISLPRSLETIGGGAFAGNSFTTITLYEGLKSIGEEAFERCSLASIAIPSTVETIGNNAFYRCSSLTTVSMSGATILGASALGNCMSLTTLVLDETASGGAEEDDDPFDGDERDNITVYVPTGSAATYLVSSWNTLVEADSELHWNFNEIGIYYDFYEEEDGEQVNYATYYTDAVGEFSNDVTPNIVTKAGESGEITYTEVTGYIPANTGLLLSAPQSVAPTKDFATYYYHPYETTISSVETADVSSNMLLGTNDANGITTVGPNGETSGYYFYKLTLDASDTAGTLGFYWGASEGGQFTSAAGKAYLAVPMDANGLSYYSFKKDEGDTTGISAVESASEKAVSGIYTIQGVRVSNMNQPGLYIVDGKKVLVK